jgi:LysM repeat protein
MNIQQLFTALQPFQNTAAKTLTIPASGVTGWTDVHALLVAALQNQTLAITAITAFPAAPSGNAIRYQGEATLFPWSAGGTQTVLAVTATFSVDAAGAPQLLVRADVPAGATGWVLGNSLDGLGKTDLASVVFSEGFFLLTTRPVTPIDYSGTAQPFVNFQGVLALSGPFAIGQALLLTPLSRTVAGTIDLTQGAMPVVTLGPAGGATISLAGIAFEFGATLSAIYQTLPYEDPNDPTKTTIVVPFSAAQIVATLTFGAGPALLLTLSVLPQGDFYTLSVGEALKPLSSWSELDSLSSGINLGALIPSQVPAALVLILRRLELSLYFPDTALLPKVKSITFDVMMDVGNWPLLPNDILTVQDVGALMTVTFVDGFAPAASGSLYTDFTIVEEVPMIASLAIPDLLLTAELQSGVTVSVESLMEAVMLKLTGKAYAPPVEMEISRLEMSVDVRDRTFGFGTDIETDWSVAFGNANGGTLLTLGFDGISFNIDYDGQLLQGELTAFAHINEGEFYFTAVSPGNDAGWGFGGGLIPDSTLSVTNLLLGFMYPKPGTVPSAYGLPNLVIDRLAATLSTDASNNPKSFTFDGGLSVAWTFTVFGGGVEFKLSATVELKGEKGGQAVALPFRLTPPGARLRAMQVSPPLVPLANLADDETWNISGNVQGTLSLYGLLISAGYQFDTNNSSLNFGIWYKERGIQATLTQQIDPKTQVKESILTIRLGDLSFGEILEYLINLALPGENRRLSAPWDVLYQINFKNLSLVVNLTTNDVEIRYSFDLDLVFARFDSIGLIYKSVNGEGRVYVELTGEFLGQPFGEDDEPLAWDVINDPAPEVPGKGPKLIDLRFVGLGQHIALSVPVSELDTVEKVITALKASMNPVTGGGNPLTDPAAAALRYDGNSNWMFGLDATILDTVTLSAVFFDPVIYGGLIEMSGPRAGPLAGLRFELLYRKITNDIGELSVSLRVPDMFRHLEFGAVSVTLGLIHVDIYTNGNFRVDLGFPHNQDFSVAFAVEVFPFVGEGGFYFAYLTGATSERVPLISNGEFSPVIEAGIGLAVGLGKDFQAGPLKAGLKVEIYGIFEGVFAPFNPYDRSIAPDNYFWIQGTAGIVGTLYGSVDFVIIKAEVSIVARASVTFVLEAHRPSQVDLKLTVTAKAKVKIVFITIHFSFDFTLEQSFTIGTATATPWIVGTNSERLAPHFHVAEAVRLARGPWNEPVPRLRQQRSQRPARRLTRLRHARHEFASLRDNPDYRSRHWGRMAAARARQPHLAVVEDTAQPWVPVAVFTGGAKTAHLQFLPMFTVADPATLAPVDRVIAAADDPANQIEIVLGFVAENTIDPLVHGHAAVRGIATDHVHHFDDDGDTALAKMVEAFFRWAALEGAGKSGGQNLSLLALEDVLAELADPAFQQSTFGYGNLSNFMIASLHFEVAAYPSGAMPSGTSGTFVPVIPEITAKAVRGETKITRNYATYKPVSSAYALNLSAYFQQLLTNATSGVASRPSAGAEQETPQDEGASAASLAELIFGEYFVLVTQAALQGAIALLQNYPYSYPASGGPSLQTIATSFASLSMPVTLARGQRLVDLALMTGHHPEQLAALNPAAARGDSRDVDLPVGVTALSIAEDNPAAPIAADLSVPMPALPYQVRSGQSLNDVAKAVPFVATPLTGAAVGAASAAIGGLLRAGDTLQIPAFTYTPITGDTQNFLTAFFQVRNEGVFGVDHLDWYEQAISTLNPGIDDWSAITPATNPIKIPTAYLNSQDVPPSYHIHAGDTLARIAASFARFQAMDNTTNPVVSAPVTVPAMAHIIASTDTFASLAGDFTGLAASALIAANVDARVLTPLTVLALPPFTAKIPAGQSLQSLAAAYDLGMPDLVDIIKGIAGIFAGPTKLTIRDVPARSVDQFVTDLKSMEINSIAAQISNFLAHGLRAPATDDADFTNLTPQQVLDGAFTGKLYGVADLIGQQFDWPDTTVPVELTLTHAASSWVSFVDAVTVGGEFTVTPRMRALNPRLARDEVVRPGLILSTDDLTEIKLTVNQATFGTVLPSTTVTLNASAPVVPPNFATTSVQYNFQVIQHWQAAARPTLPAAAAAASPGEPSLWPLPSNLQQVAAAGANHPFALNAVSLTAAPGSKGTPLKSYAWAIQIPIGIHRVANPNDPGDTATVAGGSELGSPWIDGLYLVKGTGPGDSERLYDLWIYLTKAAKSGTDSGALYLLYPPNATGVTPKGYASDAVDSAKTVLLKTNLSTVTRDPGDGQRRAMDVPSVTTYSASIAESVNFLTLLWQASVVVEGGFYLRYDADGAGLPDFVFDETGRGTIQLLCLLHSQTSAASAGGTLLALNNVAVVGDNVDASAMQVYAEQTGLGAPTTRFATLPPGSVGFEITRVDPAPPVGTSPTPLQISGMLYGLIGYQIGAATGFVASNEAVPQGPAPEAADQQGDGSNMLYSQAISVYPRATAAGYIAQNNPWLPAASADPYAGVSASAAAALSFAAHDVFGNKAVVTDPIAALSVPDRYTDRLAGIGEWPGTNWSYTLTGIAPSAMLEIDGALQTNNYLPDPQTSSEKALRSASTHALKFREAFYQVSRPGITVSVATSFAASALTPPLAPLIGYLSGAYVYTSQIAGLPIKTHTIGANQTLAQVAAAYSLSAEALLRDNLDRPVSALFATAVITPVFNQVKHNEKLNAFAARVGLTADALLSQWNNGAAAIVPNGTDLVIASTTGALAAGKTLRDYATTSQCTAADIARANRSVPGLITEGTTLTVAGVLVATVEGSTFATLVDDFAAAGVTTSVEEIATRNQDIPELFTSGGAITTYAVDRRLTSAASNIAAVVAALFNGVLADFITANGDLPGLIVQDTRLQTGRTTEAPPAEGLRRYLSHLSGITIADFAVANASSVMKQDSVLLLPALLDPAPLAAVPYGIQANMTLDSIAARFGISAQTLGIQDQNIPGIFVPGQTVTVAGSGSLTTGPEDSLASLIVKFPVDKQPTLSALITAIAAQQKLLLPGAALPCPVPTASLAGGGGALSLTTLAGAFLTSADALKLARSNAALAGFLKQGAGISVGGHAFTVGPWQTLANTLDAVNTVVSPPLAYDAFLIAILDQAIVDPASKVLLPPPGALLRMPLPAAPAMVDTITQLATALTLKRPAGEIDTNFKSVPEVAGATTAIVPQSAGAPATLADFAGAVATAYGGAVWAATGAANRGLGNQGNQRLYAVRFGAPSGTPVGNALRKVELGNAASFLGLPPLANNLVSRLANIRTYQSGGASPFSSTAEATMFQAVDVMDWATDFFATVELVLSPTYASAAYFATVSGAAGSTAFNDLVAAKASLANKIAAQLDSIETDGGAIDSAAARAALQQMLSVNLSAGFATDAVIQVPSTVQATFASERADAGGHRLTGKVNVAGTNLSTTTTLQALATGFTVSAEAIVELLAATPNVLATGTVLTLGQKHWTIDRHDTLNDGMAVLQTTPAVFTQSFSGQAPLFRDGGLLTIDGYTAAVSLGDSLDTMADALDVSLRYLVLANQDLPGLLTGTVFINGAAIVITPATSSLSGLAEAQSLTVEMLTGLIAYQGVLAVGAVMHIVRWVPEYSLTPGKIDLGASSGALTLLLNVKSRAHYRRLFLNLGFDITALEYAIARAPYVDGYETSKWLHFVLPLPKTASALGGAVIETDIGQLDIPIPLRAYPITPRLVNQRALPTFQPGNIDPSDPVATKITKIEAWSYFAQFEMQLAAQDTASIRIGLNYREALLHFDAFDDAPDPFAALAEYASNAAMIKADLVTLIRSPAGGGTLGQSAVLAMADLATKVAANWGFVGTTPADAEDAGDGLMPTESYGFELQTRIKSGAGGEPLLDALVLIRSATTASWGPGGEIPSLGYLDAAGALTPLAKPVIPPGPLPQNLFYQFREHVPDQGRRVYVIWYDNLNVVAYQNARASLSITRNQNLVPGKTTNKRFVYQTPQLTFTNVAVPNLRWDDSLLFGTGTVAALPAALTTVFTDILGSPPTAADVQQKLIGRYGYRLAAENGPDSPLSPGDLISLVPMFYRPVFAYDDTVPTDTGATVGAWFADHTPEPANTAFLGFGLQLFSTLMPNRKQPLVDFARLDYQLQRS